MYILHITYFQLWSITNTPKPHWKHFSQKSWLLLLQDIYKVDPTAPETSTEIHCPSCNQPLVKPSTVLFGSSLPRELLVPSNFHWRNQQLIGYLRWFKVYWHQPTEKWKQLQIAFSFFSEFCCVFFEYIFAARFFSVLVFFQFEEKELKKTFTGKNMYTYILKNNLTPNTTACFCCETLGSSSNYPSWQKQICWS